MKGVFIAGTDTDVGKTYVSTLIIRHLRHQGLNVAARKPIASGCIDGCADARLLADASEEDEYIVCPYRFDHMCSPGRAISLTGSPILLADLRDACQPQTLQNFTLVEGAGGWLSPLTPDASNATLAQTLQFPTLLVASNKLGCINHVRLTLAHIQQLQLPCLGVLLNDTACDSDPMTIDELRYLIDFPIWSLSYGAKTLDTSLIKSLRNT